MGILGRWILAVSLLALVGPWSNSPLRGDLWSNWPWEKQRGGDERKARDRHPLHGRLEQDARVSPAGRRAEPGEPAEAGARGTPPRGRSRRRAGGVPVREHQVPA